MRVSLDSVGPVHDRVVETPLLCCQRRRCYGQIAGQTHAQQFDSDLRPADRIPDDVLIGAMGLNACARTSLPPGRAAKKVVLDHKLITSDVNNRLIVIVAYGIREFHPTASTDDYRSIASLALRHVDRNHAVAVHDIDITEYVIGRRVAGRTHEAASLAHRAAD